MAAMRSQKVKGFFTIATREVGMPAAAVATRAERVRSLSIVWLAMYLESVNGFPTIFELVKVSKPPIINL